MSFSPALQRWEQLENHPNPRGTTEFRYNLSSPGLKPELSLGQPIPQPLAAAFR
jgi:hypothetical protein